MKLWLVSAEYTICVMAETSREAEAVAKRHADENGLPVLWATPIVKTADIPNAWRYLIPYGSKGDETCREIMEGK